MSHSVLLKHGWIVIFETGTFTAYQLDETIYVKWFNGKGEMYNV